MAPLLSSRVSLSTRASSISTPRLERDEEWNSICKLCAATPTLYPISAVSARDPRAGRGMEHSMTVSHLHTLVTALDESRPMSAPPALVRIRGPVACPERIDDLALDQILGFTAPASCSALGVVATGWAFAYGDPGPGRAR